MNKIIAALLLLALLITPGCWSRREIEDLAIVEVVGVDYLEDSNEYEVSALIIRPAAVSGQGEGAPYFILTGRGKSFQEAVRQMAAKSARSVFFGQSEAFILGEEMARNGVQMVLDHFLRNPEIRFHNWILVTRGSAKDMLTTVQPLMSQEVGGELRGLINIEMAETALSRPQNFRQMLAAIAAAGEDPLTAVVTLEGAPKTSADQQGGGGSGGQTSSIPGQGGGEGGQQQAQPQEKQVLSLRQTAAFMGDKLVGFFNETETRGVLWLAEETTRRTIIIDNPLPYPGTVTLLTTGSSAEIKPVIAGNSYRIEVQIREEGDISELSHPFNFNDQQALMALEAAKAKKIEDEVRAAFRRAQQLGTDVFGFGGYFHRSHPEQWKQMEPQWRDIFSNQLQLSVQVQSKIRRTGFAGPPPPIR